MKRYILTESCFIIDTKNNDCKIYAEEMEFIDYSREK